MIRLSSAGTELICEGLFSHPNEIWDLASCPFDQRIFSTVFSSGKFLYESSLVSFLIFITLDQVDLNEHSVLFLLLNF